MQDLEKNEGFDESMLDNKTGKRSNFLVLERKETGKVP